VDNGDGTATDNLTGLMWEKKYPGRGDIHDSNNAYSWSIDGTNPNGTLYTDFLAQLNKNITDDPSQLCFARHCDWRIPTLAELRGFDPCASDQTTCLSAIVGGGADRGMVSSTRSSASNSVWFAFAIIDSPGTTPATFFNAARAVRGVSR
jgi:hypothetical protein